MHLSAPEQDSTHTEYSSSVLRRDLQTPKKGLTLKEIAHIGKLM